MDLPRKLPALRELLLDLRGTQLTEQSLLRMAEGAERPALEADTQRSAAVQGENGGGLEETTRDVLGSEGEGVFLWGGSGR